MPGPPRWPLLVFSGRGVHLPQLVIHSKNTESQIRSHADGRGRRCISLVPSARLARFPWPEQTPAVEDDRQPRSTLSQDTRDQVTGNLTRTCLPQTAAGAETWKETCVPAVFFLVLGCVSRPMKGLGERAGGGVGAARHFSALALMSVCFQTSVFCECGHACALGTKLCSIQH